MSARAWVIAIGGDDAGYTMKELLKKQLTADDRVAEVRDVGVHSSGDSTAYPHVGIAAAELVASGDVDRALLVCGTGIGVAISATKVAGVRATVAHDPYSVERSVLSNNCQVLCFGARVIAPQLAAKLTDGWLDLRFDDHSPSAGKIAVLDAYENSS